MATTVSAAKAKAEFAEYVRKAEAGDPVVITRHGKAVVALVPADRWSSSTAARGRALRRPGGSRGRLAWVGGAGATARWITAVESAARASPRPLSRWHLFDTDAISELLKPRPKAGYVKWLAIPREEQFTSAVVVGELYKGAFRSSAVARHLENIERRVLPAVSVLSYDAAAARIYGHVRAHLESRAGRWPTPIFRSLRRPCITIWSS